MSVIARADELAQAMTDTFGDDEIVAEWAEAVREIGRENERLSTTTRGAVEALKRYGFHDGDCPACLVDDPGPCRCGWDDAFTTIGGQ
jgi:DNA/RNA-binding domain of Phe-tRNA-synthetase-like protein